MTTAHPSSRRQLLLAAGAASLGLAVPTLRAQQAAFPTRPVRLVVGFTPGGVPDIAARLLAPPLSERWGQPVTVENRLGAGSGLAAQAVAVSAPDGHTLLSVSSAHAILPVMYPKLPFDPVKDFAGVSLTATGPALLLVAPDLPVKTVADLIALAGSRPGQLNFASSGVGSGAHFAAELLKSQAKMDVAHIPMKGIPEAITETMAGRTQFFVSPFASALGLVRDGKARAIAVTSLKRMAELPDLPTVAESGLPGYEWVFWYGLLAPAKTPRPLIEQINTEVTRILRLPETRQRLQALGTEPAPSTPQDLDQLLAREVESFRRTAQAANIKPES